jgi:stringent starvation protein B
MKSRGPKSKKPYLLRAIYEWIVDNDLTPHILVDANAKGVSIPPSAIKDDRVLLNISPRAVFGLNLGNDLVSLKASFSGAQREVSFPIQSVLALFSREDVQHGIVFGSEYDEEYEDIDDGVDESHAPEPATREPFRVVEATHSDGEAPTEQDPNKPDRKGRANLRVVK